MKDLMVMKNPKVEMECDNGCKELYVKLLAMLSFDVWRMHGPKPVLLRPRILIVLNLV